MVVKVGFGHTQLKNEKIPLTNFYLHRPQIAVR